MASDRTPRYQVFLSSTYSDLREERQSITTALLKMGRCFPAGMELFTASSLPAWSVITDALDGTDYLVLILANRYGSAPTGETVSFTEKEYDYAIANEIPVLPFLSHDRPLLPDQQESDTARANLERFRHRVEESHTVEYWSSLQELVQQVPTALHREFTARPRPGWVRGTTVGAATELPRPAVVDRQLSQREQFVEHAVDAQSVMQRELSRRPPPRDIAALLMIAEPVGFIRPDALQDLTVDAANLRRVVARVAGEGNGVNPVASWSGTLGGRDISALSASTPYAEGVAISSRRYTARSSRSPGDRSAAYDYCEVAVTDDGGVRLYAEPFGWRTGLNLVAEPGLDLNLPVVLTRRLLDLIPAIWEQADTQALKPAFRVAIRSVGASNLPALAENGTPSEQRLQADYSAETLVGLQELEETAGEVARKLLRNLLRHFGVLDQYSEAFDNGRPSR